MSQAPLPSSQDPVGPAAPGAPRMPMASAGVAIPPVRPLLRGAAHGLSISFIFVFLAIGLIGAIIAMDREVYLGALAALAVGLVGMLLGGVVWLVECLVHETRANGVRLQAQLMR